jgi:catechol 2,3-dioxygenase-like lactoylglutathione lyase family enzyme
MKANYPRMHVSLYVKNLQKTNEFYTQFFGQQPDKVEHKYSKFTLNSPALIISFIENSKKVNSNFGHLGFQVNSVDELKNRLEKAKALNLVQLEEEGTNCCYALQDKFWMSDPDGVAWEVYYFHHDSKFNDPEYAMDDSSQNQDTECCSNAKPKALENCC